MANWMVQAAVTVMVEAESPHAAEQLLTDALEDLEQHDSRLSDPVYRITNVDVQVDTVEAACNGEDCRHAWGDRCLRSEDRRDQRDVVPKRLRPVK